LADDAGVYKLTDDLAIVETVDMIAPIVDDPFVFGKIAATNCLSDVYAMGGKPITAMNVVCFPSDTVDITALGDILRGALEVLVSANVSLVGGHSVRDDEVRFGLSVTGIIHPDKIITKSGAKPGDDIVITKPLGTGILTTAIKAGVLPQEVYDKLIKHLLTLNKDASEAMQECGIKCATDITGFGLIGHLAEMIEPGNVSADIFSAKVPMIREAVQYAKMGLIPEGMYANWEYREYMVNPGVASEDMMAILYDPQTSGGLLMCCPHDQTPSLIEFLKQHDTEGFVIERIKENKGDSSVIKII
jgi:selenide,water dikinase